MVNVTYLFVFILRICKISGLQTLVRLDVLDLHGNQASLIVPSLPSKYQCVPGSIFCFKLRCCWHGSNHFSGCILWQLSVSFCLYLAFLYA